MKRERLHVLVLALAIAPKKGNYPFPATLGPRAPLPAAAAGASSPCASPGAGSQATGRASGAAAIPRRPFGLRRLARPLATRLTMRRAPRFLVRRDGGSIAPRPFPLGGRGARLNSGCPRLFYTPFISRASHPSARGPNRVVANDTQLTIATPHRVWYDGKQPQT
jgi:hypothetical protein